jgi:hypothetical protein
MPEMSNAKHAASPTDAVALAAYLDWVAAGKPSGRADEFWLKAEARLGNGDSDAREGGARKANTAKSGSKPL